ncbi:NAD(P)H-quinone oxidoreductase subunit 5, chloroplastic [Cichlidogyrus casuarinus]|uniref:NAD(P)H-quinone oxidoreductase subunit 5, chloroplastic n=1 Tax=Cichlidogyrus casuarinus TaxID=1844966 RepID=A0ABD2QHJ7_9PLAT
MVTNHWLVAGESFNCVDPGGFCLPTVIKWRFDGQSISCVQFLHGGCGAYQNKFDSQSECEKKCNSEVNKCDDPRDTSFCLSAFKRYYYNKETKKCETFIWGGCKPNRNNFVNLDRCQQTCEPSI